MQCKSKIMQAQEVFTCIANVNKLACMHACIHKHAYMHAWSSFPIQQRGHTLLVFGLHFQCSHMYESNTSTHKSSTRKWKLFNRLHLHLCFGSSHVCFIVLAVGFVFTLHRLTIDCKGPQLHLHGTGVHASTHHTKQVNYKMNPLINSANHISCFKYRL